MNDDYRLAVSRWLLGMSVDTGRVLVREAEQQHEPYVLALATVRLALDSALDEPSSAPDALEAADAISSSYNSQYIRDYALAAHGTQAIVFGDLSVALDAGQRLVNSPTRAMQVHGISHLARAACCVVTKRRSIRRWTRRNGLRRVRYRARRKKPTSPSAFSICCEATSMEPRPELALNDPWLAARDSVDRGYVARRGRPSHRFVPAAQPAKRWPMPSVGSSTTTKITGTRRCGSQTSTVSD